MNFEEGKCNTESSQDRKPLALGDLIEPRPEGAAEEMDEEDEDMVDVPKEDGPPPAKIDQLIKLLTLLPKGDKSLVFSQFTSFLDKV